MLKKIISFLVTLMMISGMISIPVMASDATAPFVLAGASGYNLSYLVDTKGYSSLSSDVTLLSPQSLKLNGNGMTDGWKTDESARWDFYNKFGKTFDWSDYNYINVMVKNGSETPLGFRFTLGINRANYDGSNGYWYYDVKDVVADDWTVVSMKTDKFTQTYAGTKTEGDKWSEMNTIQSLVFDGIKGNFYVDSIWLSTSLPAAAVCTEKSVASDAADNVLMSTTDYTFTYSEELAASTVQNAIIEITENSAACSAEYYVTYSGNKLTVSFDEMLKPSTSYSISISGVIDRFGIAASDVSLSFATSDTVVFPDEVVIADFTRLEDIEKAEMDVDSQNKLFGDKSGTISAEKIAAGNISMSPVATDGLTVPTNWTQYTHLNLWVYSAEVNSDTQFAVIMRSPGTSGNSAYKIFKQDFSGWKKISVKLSDFGTGANFSISNVQDAYVSLMFSSINGNPFNKTYKKLSFAKMWLSTEKPDGTKELFNSNSTSSTKDVFSNSYASLSTEVVESNDKSLKLTGTGANENESKNPTFAAQDWTDYNHINFRIKNGNSTDSKFTFYATVNKANATGAAGYWSKTFTVSGTSWQTVSLAIPSGFSFQSNTSTPIVYTEMSHIEGLRFDYINGTMYLEKIWLSTEPCTNVPTLESISVANDAEISAYTRKIDFKYSELLSSKLPTVTVAPAADHVVTCENDTVSVIFTNGLSAGTNYTVTVGADVRSRYSISSGTPASVSFSTKPYSAERSDTAVYARYTSSINQDGKMLIAIYEADGSLAKVETVSNAANGVLTLSNDYVSVSAEQSAKIFVWADDNSTIKPLEGSVEFK